MICNLGREKEKKLFLHYIYILVINSTLSDGNIDLDLVSMDVGL